jgi:hypothetical protein
MFPTTRRPLAVLTGATVLLLAACSGGAGVAPGDPAATAATTTADTAVGPLDAYALRIYGRTLNPTAEEQRELAADDARRLQEMDELVAACMQEQGFRYPAPTSAPVAAVDVSDLPAAPGTREFAEQFGYGISTDPWGDAGAARPDPTPEDPNAELLATMSPAEAAAFQEALHGTITGDGVEYDWRSAGCTGAALHEVDDLTDGIHEFAGLEADMNGYFEGVRTGPELAALHASWSTCLADAGFGEHADPDAAQSELAGAWDALRGADGTGDGTGPAPEPDPEAARAFTEREIAMALADLACQEEVDYADVLRDLDHRAQQEFVDAHRAELDAWAEAAERAAE